MAPLKAEAQSASKPNRRRAHRLAELLLAWYQEHERDLPWRRRRNPYGTLVSEIMLQQTTVKFVKDYYKRFMKRFPTLKSLAEAKEDEVLTLWSGLGYYRRARNLRKAAQVIVKDHRGRFPRDYEDLKSLPGIGDYTAAAIQSMAYQEAAVPLDGNLLRVLSRLEGIEAEVESAPVKQAIRQIILMMMEKGQPGDIAEALMDFGATQCTPKNPECQTCPFKRSCQAFKSKKVNRIPKLKARKKMVAVYAAIGVCYRNGKLLVSRRSADQVMGGMFEFPGGKVEPGESSQACVEREFAEEVGLKVKASPEPLLEHRHTYTHHRVRLAVHAITQVKGRPRALEVEEVRWVSLDDLDQLPMLAATTAIVKKLKSQGFFKVFQLTPSAP